MRKCKKLRFLTIIFVFFWFPAVSIYLDYNSLVEADLLLDVFQYEVPDLEDLLADKQDFHFSSGQTLLPDPFEAIFFSCILASLCQGILSGPESFILRC